MTSVACPLCGKYSPMDSFSTSEVDDIRTASMRGLGRGKGFEATERGSLFDSPEYQDTVSLIAKRTLEIVKLLFDYEAITYEDVRKALESDSADEEEDT